MVKELIEHHANINEKTNSGRTALHFASLEGYLEIVKELIKNSSLMFNDRDNCGWSPLHDASRCGKLSLVKELIDYSDLSITDNKGLTALDVAYNEEIKQFIRDYQELPTIKEPSNN